MRLTTVLLAAKKQAIQLPSEYQRVEYIESGGKQYIDTGVIVSQHEHPAMEAEMLNPVNQYALVGAYDPGSAYQMGFSNRSTITMNAGFATAATTSVEPSKKHKLYLSNGIQKVDDVVINNFNTRGSLTSASLRLFGRYSSDNKYIANYAVRIYYWKFWGNGTLLHYFVPCYRKVDGEIGMYDLISSKFFSNNGTGLFVKGADI